MALYAGEVGPCSWALVVGDLDEATISGFVTHLREVVSDIAPGRMVLDLLYDVPMPSALQRRRIAEVLQGARGLERAAGHAVVVNSSLGRGLMTAINWVVRPDFDEAIFADPDAAFDWLDARGPGLDVAAVREAIREAYPRFGTLAW